MRIAAGRMLNESSDTAFFGCPGTLARRVMPGSGSRLQIEGNEIRTAGRLRFPVEDGDAHCVMTPGHQHDVIGPWRRRRNLVALRPWGEIPTDLEGPLSRQPRAFRDHVQLTERRKRGPEGRAVISGI